MNGHDRREHSVRELLVQAQPAAALVLASLEEGKHQPYALERREKARPSRDAGAARSVYGGRHGYVTGRLLLVVVRPDRKVAAPVDGGGRSLTDCVARLVTAPTSSILLRNPNKLVRSPRT